MKLYFSHRNKYNKAVYTKDTKIDGKVIVITGANTGIGKENAIDLARRGGKIYIACRDVTRGEEALKDIKMQSGSENVHFLQLDLASLDSVREFSDKFHKLEKKLDVLINNAGVMMCPEMKTKDGFELQFGTNHLGHFLLTNLLLDLIKAAAPSRIISVSSEGHKMSGIVKEDLMFSRNYSSMKAYGQSKCANILFANELAKRLKDDKVVANSCHPGVVKTELGRYINLRFPFLNKFILEPVFHPFFKTPVEGAQTQIRMAIDPDLENVTGKYFYDCEIQQPVAHARDEEAAEWLWNESFKLVKLNQ
jgi:retinol dehydrogenase 12